MRKAAPRPRVFNDPGHAHELTFSVYRRMRLLQDPVLCRRFLENLDRARKDLSFEVWAYVLMPDHVHLLVWPKLEKYDVGEIRKSIKQPFSRDVLAEMARTGDLLLRKLTVASPKGRFQRHFWQPGKGYDRNVHSRKVCMDCIDYIHNNPVVERMVKLPWEFEFSSAAWYQGLRPVPFEVDRAKY